MLRTYNECNVVELVRGGGQIAPCGERNNMIDQICDPQTNVLGLTSQVISYFPHSWFVVPSDIYAYSLRSTTNYAVFLKSDNR